MTTVDVTREPRVYGPTSPYNSFFVDVAAYANNQHPQHRAAAERLARHAKEVAIEARSGSPEGRRARCAWRDAYWTESNRDEFAAKIEERAMSTGSASGGAFVTPDYLVNLFATFRSPYRSFADQCMTAPLPPSGLEISLPAFTSASSVGTQPAENSGVDEVDPSAAYLSATVKPLSGQITVSQQLYDRGGMPGMATDMIVYQQLREQLDAQVDSYALAQALTNAGTVTDDDSLTITALYGDLAQARELLADSAGTRLRPTHAFMTSDLWGYVTRQVDSSARPIVVPSFTAQPWATLVANGDPRGEGWTGHVLPSGLALFSDDNIPTTNGGADTQILVSRPQTVLLLEGNPIPTAYPESGATTLSVVLGLRAYVAAIPRFEKGTASITGSAYSTSLT